MKPGPPNSKFPYNPPKQIEPRVIKKFLLVSLMEMTDNYEEVQIDDKIVKIQSDMINYKT